MIDNDNPAMRMLHRCAQDYFPPDKDIIDVCELYRVDHSWKALYAWFNRYKNFVFKNNQRILVLDHDTDYYPDVSTIGNNLYNLIRVMSWLDISTDHVVLLTAHYGLEQDVVSLCDQFNMTPPKVIEFSQWYAYPNIHEHVMPITDKKFSHLFITLNNQPRSHRMCLLAMLHQKKLADKGIISWHATSAGGVVNSSTNDQPTEIRIQSPYHFRTTDPFSRINDDLNICKRSIYLTSQYRSILDHTSVHPLITGRPFDKKTKWGADFFRYAPIYVITETVGQYRHVCFSEKTWKAMVSKKPFLFLGARHSLARLKKLGFMTFDSIWDESYDRAETVYERVDSLTDTLLQLSHQNWYVLAERCANIVDHNYNHIAQFQQQELALLSGI